MAIPQGKARVSLSVEHSLRWPLLPYPEARQALWPAAAPSAPTAVTGRMPRKAARRQHYLLQRQFKGNLHSGHTEAACSGGYRNKGFWSLGWHRLESTCGAAIAPSSCNGSRAAWSDRDLGISTSCRLACSQPLDSGGCCTTALAGALFTSSEQTCAISSGGL